MMTKEQDTLAFIKWNQNSTELTDLLKGYTKDELISLADRQRVAVKKSWNKTKTAEELAENITQLAETIYQGVLQEVLVRLPDLDTTVYRVKDMKEIEGFIPLIEQGFFFVSSHENSMFLLIPEEILFSVKDRLTEDDKETDAVSSEHSRKIQLLSDWRDRSKAIYGNVSLEHLKATYNRYFDEPVTMDEIKNLLNQLD